MQIVRFEYNKLIYRRDTFVETEKISLEKILQKKGHLKTEDALNLLQPVVFYLAGLHRSGRFHGAVSPSAIYIKNSLWFCSPLPKPLLKNPPPEWMIDGTARLCQAKPDPAYQPLEHFLSHGTAGPQSDVYSLCAVLYRMITGKVPSNALDRFNGTPLELPSRLGAAISLTQEAALAKGLELTAGSRFDDAGALYDALYKTNESKPEDVQSDSGTASDAKQDHTNHKNKYRKPLFIAAICAAVCICIPAPSFIFNEHTAPSPDTGTPPQTEQELPFIIGSLSPVTGEYADIGIQILNGINLAVDEINESGGINGYPVEYISMDDKMDSELAVNCYNSLRDAGMQMLIGPAGAFPFNAVASETETDYILQLYPFTGEHNDIDQLLSDSAFGDNIFFIPVSDGSYGKDDWPDFYNAYTASYGSEATALSAAAYNAVYTIQAAAQQAQITPDMPLSDLEDALINAMSRISDDGIIEHSPENNRSSS